MSQENPIGLAELIEEVKRELLSQGPDAADAAPFFSVDEVALELQVTVRKEGKAGLNIHVIEVGGDVGRDDVQTIKVTLSPLLTKEERIRLYKARYPERWHALEGASVEAGVKGHDKKSSEEVFGS